MSAYFKDGYFRAYSVVQNTVKGRLTENQWSEQKIVRNIAGKKKVKSAFQIVATVLEYH
jgi:hypothetical protein